MQIFREKASQVLQISGKDSKDFLHRLTTVDTKNISEEQTLKALYLTGTGKMIASYFLLYCGQKFFLVPDAERLEDLRFELDKMHFTEDLEIQKISATVFELANASDSLDLSWSQDANLADLKKLPLSCSEKLTNGYFWPAPQEQTAFVLDLQKNSILREELINLQFKEDAQNPFWERQRILAKNPKYACEWEVGTNALDAGFLHWIDRDKGCYPGQEVVERSLNVGHPARALILLEADQLLEAGEELFLEDKAVGRITSSVYDGKKALVLAQVKWAKRAVSSQWRSTKGVELCLK